MKKFLLFCFLISSVCSFCQSGGTYSADLDKAFGYIKKAAFKHGYDYLITFGNVNEAAINVNQNTGYLIFFVYDNTQRPGTDFKAFLMTPDSALRKKYTARPYDRGQVGVARAAQLEFHTQQFSKDKADTRPVKLEAKPKATIYVFLKK